MEKRFNSLQETCAMFDVLSHAVARMTNNEINAYTKTLVEKYSEDISGHEVANEFECFKNFVNSFSPPAANVGDIYHRLTKLNL